MTLTRDSLTRRGAIGMLAATAITGSAMVSGCQILFPTKYRFRMIVEVDTPNGRATGSSVYQVWAANSPGLLSSERSRDWGVSGQATMVDLPSRPIFALMKTGNQMREDLAQMSMAALDPNFNNDIVESAGRIAGKWTTLRGQVPRSDWPLMVAFDNIADPMSVHPVPDDILARMRVTVETTSDRISSGIENRLQWLNRIKGGYLDGGFAASEAAMGLDGTSFSTEIK